MTSCTCWARAAAMSSASARASYAGELDVEPEHKHVAVEQSLREPPERLGEQRADGEAEQQAEPHERVQGGEDPTAELVGHRLLEDREAEHVHRAGTHAEEG